MQARSDLPKGAVDMANSIINKEEQELPGLKCHGLDSDIAGGDDLMVTARSQPASAPEITVNVEHDDAMLHAASLIHASGVFVLPFWLRGAKTDVSSLKQVIYGASPMPRPVIEQAMALWGRERFWQYYGQTECPLTISVLRPEDHEGELLGSCGKPCVDVELRLFDEAGNDVPYGEPGEIAVKAPSMMKGYYNADQLNADMIITGGYNVYPREVEDVLTEHPAVAECSPKTAVGKLNRKALRDMLAG